MLSRIKKNDTVIVISGKDKRKQGVVVEVNPGKEKIMVKGVGIVAHHEKPKGRGERGSIVKKESYISVSKVMPLCGSCHKPCRVRTKFLEDGDKKVRVCHRCGGVI
jgi:large subunit ribosomal protein L24